MDPIKMKRLDVKMTMDKKLGLWRIVKYENAYIRWFTIYLNEQYYTEVSTADEVLEYVF